MNAFFSTASMGPGGERAARCSSPGPFGHAHWIGGRYRGSIKSGGATLDSPFCHIYRFHGDKL